MEKVNKSKRRREIAVVEKQFNQRHRFVNESKARVEHMQQIEKLNTLKPCAFAVKLAIHEMGR